VWCKGGEREPRRIALPLPDPDVPAAFDLRDRCRRIGWAAGLPGLALIFAASALWVTPRLETRLAREADAVARAVAEPGAEPWLRVTAEGRDLVVTGEAPDAATRDAAHDRLARLDGVRRLVGPVGVVELAAPFVWVATRTRDGVDLTGSRPAEIGTGALAERLTPALEPGTALRDRTRAALGAPPDFSAAATYALARLRALAPGGRVMLEDLRLSVAGEAASVADEEALRAALAAPPVGYTLGRVEIAPAAVADFRFVVTRPPGGGLDLSGYVVSEAARSAIREQAAQISETGRIVDRTRTARGLPPEIDAAAMARFALQLAGLMQDGSVTVADSAVTLNGIALDAQAIPEIEALIGDAIPAGLKRGGVTLGTRPLSPYRVGLRREADAVTLTGHLPDAATREALLGTLRPRLFRERLVDRTRLGQGAPDTLARALTAVAAPLALLARGEVRIADRSVTLSGESLYPQTARRIREDLPAALPEGWRAEIAVTVPGETPARTPDSCAQALDAGLKGPGPVFAPGSATLKPAFYPSLDALAGLARTCPSLRLTVTGHADPAGAAPAPRPAVDAAVESTASLEAGKPSAPRPADAKPASKPPVKAAAKKAEPAKPETAKPDAARPDPAKPEAAKTEPAPDLPQQRALVVAEYLLQAGLRPEQVAVAPLGTARPADQGVGLAPVARP
jgi:OOP family OmpA-OmpF porin